MNAVADGLGLKLNVSEMDHSQDLELAKSVANIFRISKNSADNIIQEVIKAAKLWRKEATHLGISSQEQDAMENAFRVCYY